MEGSTCLLKERRYDGGRPSVCAFYTERVMKEKTSTLYAKLLGETARISWQELQPFFARGQLLWVEPSTDLVEVAQAVADDDSGKVAAWLQEGRVARVDESHAQDYLARDPELWAVVVSPWVLIQERATGATMH